MSDGYKDLSGRTLGGRYELIEPIDSGGTSVIYRAHFIPGDREVALKLYVPEGLASSKIRFRREFRALYQFSHRSQIGALDYQDDGERIFYTMPLIDGPTLADRVISDGPMSVAEVLKIGLELCDVIAFIHSQGAIHRDLSPRNVFIVDDGIKVIDLGVVKLLPGYYSRPGRYMTHPELRAVTQEAIGSPGWSAPEIWVGNPVKKSDVWSIGALLYYALAGERPYKDHLISEPPPPLPDTVPEDLEAVIFAALDVKIEERLMVSELHGFLEEQLAELKPGDVDEADEGGTLHTGRKSLPEASRSAEDPDECSAPTRRRKSLPTSEEDASPPAGDSGETGERPTGDDVSSPPADVAGQDSSPHRPSLEPRKAQPSDPGVPKRSSAGTIAVVATAVALISSATTWAVMQAFAREPAPVAEPLACADARPPAPLGELPRFADARTPEPAPDTTDIGDPVTTRKPDQEVSVSVATRRKRSPRRRHRPPRPTPAPNLTPSPVAIDGLLNAALPGVRRCIAKSFGHSPSMVVRVRVSVDGNTGAVRRTSFADSILQPGARECVQDVVAGVQFPPHMQTTSVEHAFVL